MKTNTGLVTYCRAQLGKPYWWGTFGQTATALLWDEKRKQYPGYYKDTDFAYQIGKRVHDCVGLIKGYLWSETPTSPPTYNAAQDVNVEGMKARCTGRGSISTIPDIPGVLVFMSGHVGVYIGNGNVIEARGHKYGVVLTKLSERPWKEWGKCPWITYEASGSSGSDKPAKVETEEKILIEFQMLRIGSKGAQVQTVQRLLKSMGYLGADGKSALKIDGDFGSNTAAAVKRYQKQNKLEADSVVGAKTWSALTGGVAK